MHPNKCPACPNEIRNLSAVAHNLLAVWDDPARRQFLVERIEELRRAEKAVAPIMDAHFADRRHSHPEPGETPAPVPEDLPIDPNFTQSFDASDWAKAFVGHVQRNPSIETDVDTMLGWFANAIMRGYDEHARRTTPVPEATPATDAVAALREVMDWIDNWTTPFTEDDEWPATRERVLAALAGRP